VGSLEDFSKINEIILELAKAYHKSRELNEEQRDRLGIQLEKLEKIQKQITD
jgi:hypothetical protein